MNQLPMTFRQALAVRDRMERSHPKSDFEIVGRDDMHFIQEIRPRGKRGEIIVMHGRPVTTKPRKLYVHSRSRVPRHAPRKVA